MVYFGIDIGTTNTKAVLLDREGKLLDRVSIADQGRSSAESATIWYAHFSQILDFFASRGHLAAREIICSVTAQGGTFVLLNRTYEPVSPVFSWTKQASGAVVEEFRKRFDEQGYYHRTGWGYRPFLPACKLRELVTTNTMPKDAQFMASAPDFIYSQFVHKISTDITCAQITGLCDFQSGIWDTNILSMVRIDRELLPPISNKIEILYDKVSTSWGSISFVTGSHDQYASMQAAGLVKDKGIMLGTGTAWVLNGRSSRAVYDDEDFLIHPGADLFNNSFGYIISLGQIGRGFDELLRNLKIDMENFSAIENKLCKEEIPVQPIEVNLVNVIRQPNADSPQTVRRYMEWAGSYVAYMLEKFGLAENLDKLVMSGGAAVSQIWPQIIADLCNKKVEVVNFSEFTAFGAASHARAALAGDVGECDPREETKTKIYEPKYAHEYKLWYNNVQKPALIKSMEK